MEFASLLSFLYLLDFTPKKKEFHDTRNDPQGCLPLCIDSLKTFTWANFYSKNKVLPYVIEPVMPDTLHKLQDCLDASKARIYRTRCNIFTFNTSFDDFLDTSGHIFLTTFIQN